MYFEPSESEQQLLNLISRDGESEQQRQARIEKAFLFMCERDGVSPQDVLTYVSSGEVIYQKD